MAFEVTIYSTRHEHGMTAVELKRQLCELDDKLKSSITLRTRAYWPDIDFLQIYIHRARHRQKWSKRYLNQLSFLIFRVVTDNYVLECSPIGRQLCQLSLHLEEVAKRQRR